MQISKADLFALERAYELLCDMVQDGSADLTGSEDYKLDFDAISEHLGEPKRLSSMEPTDG